MARRMHRTGTHQHDSQSDRKEQEHANYVFGKYLKANTKKEELAVLERQKSDKQQNVHRIFPCGLKKLVRHGNYASRVGARTPVYLAAVLEYLAHEIKQQEETHNDSAKLINLLEAVKKH